jgi:signal peptidase I
MITETNEPIPGIPTPETPRKQPRGKRAMHELLEVVRYAVIALAIVIPVRVFIAQPFIVSGESMVPTFEDGDYLIVDELSYRLREPERGEVIIFRYPNDPSRFFIKRIIGLPGETVTFDGDTTFTVSGGDLESPITLSEPYVSRTMVMARKTTKLGTDEFFVMGDNRPASSDSRIWGTLPRHDIIGRAYLRLLPTSDMKFLPGSLKALKIESYEQS